MLARERRVINGIAVSRILHHDEAPEALMVRTLRVAVRALGRETFGKFQIRIGHGRVMQRIADSGNTGTHLRFFLFATALAESTLAS